MNKKSVKKALLLVLCAILLVVASVMGTLAYLTSSDSITNTFTVGKVTITLTETTGEEYHLIPGNTVAKDPVVTVKANSEACWLFVEIDNGIAEIEADGATKIDAQMQLKGWAPLTGEDGVYYRTHDTKSASDATYAVFDSITTKATWDGDESDAGDIVLTAYAIQKDNLTAAAAAWTALQAQITAP